MPPRRATLLPATSALVGVVVSFSSPGPGCSPGAVPGHNGRGGEGAAARVIAAQSPAAMARVRERMESILRHAPASDRENAPGSIAAVEIGHDVRAGGSFH